MYCVCIRTEVTIATNETPGYVSNASLAARMSALVDRWDTRENQMIAVLTQPDGEVTVTDGVDVSHQIPSFPALQKQVLALVDELTGESAGVREVASQVVALANAASESAAEAEASAEASATSSQQASGSAAAALQSAADSATASSASDVSRKLSDASATASGASAAESERQATAALASATRASNEADDSASSASTALIALGDAQASRDLARAWATNVEDQPVVPGQFSALHWAMKAQAFATGSLVYLGAWDASKNSLPLDAKKGAFYKITGTGTVDGVTYRTGDNIVHNGSGWDLIDNTETVTAVAGKVGNVSLVIDDIATLSEVLSGKASINHQHAIADVVGLQPALDDKATVASLSTKAPLVHTHTVADVTDLQASLDTKAPKVSPAFTGTVSTTATSAFTAALGTLPTGQWSQYSLLYANCADQNNDQLRLGLLRTIAGSSWAGAAWRLQRTVDSTAMAYVQLGDNSGAGDALILNGGGAELRMAASVSQFTGDVRSTNWMYATNFKLLSDLRAKTAIVHLDPDIEAENVYALQPLVYLKGGKVEYGFGAQHLREVYPTMVSAYDGPAGPETLSVSAMELIAPIVAALQSMDCRMKRAGL